MYRMYKEHKDVIKYVLQKRTTKDFLLFFWSFIDQRRKTILLYLSLCFFNNIFTIINRKVYTYNSIWKSLLEAETYISSIYSHSNVLSYHIILCRGHTIKCGCSIIMYKKKKNEFWNLKWQIYEFSGFLHFMIYSQTSHI